MAITIEIVSHGRRVKASRGRNLAEVLLEAGIPLSVYCRQRGLCSKCFVEIIDGPRPELKEGEEKLLARRGLNPNHRLACLYTLDKSIRISVPEGSTSGRMPILSWGTAETADFDPAVKKYSLSLARPELGRPDSYWDGLERVLKRPHLRAGIDLVWGLADFQDKGGSEITAVVHEDTEILALEPGDTTSRAYGLAVDLGTTTLVMDLVDLNTGHVLDSETALNSQAAYGADVVSRISLVFTEPAKAARVREAATNDLARMLRLLLDRNLVPAENVYEAVIAGNTAMNHLLLGAPIRSLALAPFNAVFSTLPSLPAQEAGLRIHPHGRVYAAPNIKSFVGGDISAGLMAAGFKDKAGTFMFVDLGTNGEIVLKKGTSLLTTSTAAGPAFEGMNISRGMLALPGAIYRAENKDGFEVMTIGGGPARGICGTGLIDLAAVGLARGLITPQGKITAPEKRIDVGAGVTLDQKDIRELQLASAAIKSGMRMMLRANSLTAKDLDGLLIAGAFGSYLDTAKASAIGLLPSIEPGRITFLGNTSLAGARLLLLSQGARRRVETLVKNIEHFSLASQPGFQETFINSLEFGPWA